MGRGDPAAAAGGSRPAEEEEHSSWVPVRIAKMTNLSHNLGAALQSRWWDQHEERRWVNRAAATDPDAERQLALARDLCDVMSISWYGFSCALRSIGEGLDEAVDPARRPHPGSASWWGYWYHDCCGAGGRHGFLHLSRGQAARARELVADASARTQRIRAPMEDLERQCWPAPAAAAAVHSTPVLLGRLRRVQRLADAVLVPLRALKRLVDHLLVINGTDPHARGRRRGQSAPPPPRAAAREPMLRRSASMS